jgi:hypothetical protein
VPVVAKPLRFSYVLSPSTCEFDKMLEQTPISLVMCRAQVHVGLIKCLTQYPRILNILGLNRYGIDSFIGSILSHKTIFTILRI